MTSPVTTIHVVPHTHWDREWYQPFQRFRLRLVEVIEQVLDMAEEDPRFTFTMDGQMAAVEDFLELRPHAEERLRRHVEAGSFRIGPWRILSDEFLVSGETLVRNLEQGLASAARLGGAMPVGYLPDMFGHVAQMPQILRSAGIADTVVYRGVSGSVEDHAFSWEAPDGSVVRAEYLVGGGYGHAAAIFDGTDQLDRAAARFHEKVADFVRDDHVLMMHGADHTAPQRDLMARIDRANEADPRFRLEVTTLPDYLARIREREGELHRHVGEMRASARANMLVNVTSTHVEVKAAAGRAERALERCTEPLAALHADAWPTRELELAWAWVVESSAHDSIPTCSHDETVAKVASRYAEAAQIGEGLVERVLTPPARQVSRRGGLVWNPSPWDRTAEVLLDVQAGDETPAAVRTGDGTVVPAQVVAAHETTLLDRVSDAATARDLIVQRHDRELFGQQLTAIAIDTSSDPPAVVIDVNDLPEPADLDVDGIAAAALAQMAAISAPRWRTLIRAAARVQISAQVPAPALGWTSVVPVDAVAEPPDGAVTRHSHRLDNGLIAVRVAPDGTLDLSGDGVELTGVGRLVDGGDAGDTYNYAPPDVDRVVEEPVWVEIEPLADGPLVAGLRIRRAFDWPTELARTRTRRAAEAVRVVVTTDVEVRAGEAFVRVTGHYDNPSRDHRLRFHVPLPAPVVRSRAEGHFAIVDRGLQVEGGHGEKPLATCPAHAFVAVDGLAALFGHVTEYEVVDGRELAIALLRATSHVSQNLNAYRPEPAGPQLPVPGNQLLGERTFAFALRPTADAGRSDPILRDAQQYRTPFTIVPGGADGPGESVHREGLRLDGDGVDLTSLRRRDGVLEARLVAMSHQPRTVSLHGPFSGARLVDLTGAEIGELEVRDGALHLELRPWQICTVRLLD